ncbi:hypothetical protein ABPG75_002775, partial [Micractinium tetrahymenae]
RLPPPPPPMKRSPPPPPPTPPTPAPPPPPLQLPAVLSIEDWQPGTARDIACPAGAFIACFIRAWIDFPDCAYLDASKNVSGCVHTVTCTVQTEASWWDRAVSLCWSDCCRKSSQPRRFWVQW